MMNARNLIWIIPLCIFAGMILAGLLSANGRHDG